MSNSDIQSYLHWNNCVVSVNKPTYGTYLNFPNKILKI